MKKERKNEIWGVIFLLLGLFTLGSLIFSHEGDIGFYTSHPASPVQNYTGVIGAYLAFGLLLTFGMSAYVIPLLFLLWASCFFAQKVPERKIFNFIGLAIALFSTSTLVTLSVSPDRQFEYGGAVGYLAGTHLLRYFGFLGGFILAGACLLLSILLATDFLLYPLFHQLWKRVEKFTDGFLEKAEFSRDWIIDTARGIVPEERKRTRERKVGAKKQEGIIPTLPSMPLKVKKYRSEYADEGKKGGRAESKREREGVTRPVSSREESKLRSKKEGTGIPGRADQEEEKRHESVVGSTASRGGNYNFPPLELLRKPEFAPEGKSEDLHAKARVLESALAEFGIEVKVVEIEQGPVITRYELLPAPGVKVNSITALSDDLALAMKATSIRMIAPIPGKAAVGVEVPNSVSSLVYLRELVDSSEFHGEAALPLCLGKSTSGESLVADLADMPHILIAGTTGSGKTVCVNSIIGGLLYHASPEDLKFVMIDPKMVELAGYNKLPHMLAPVVTDVRKASHTLNWVVNEMENRYRLFATVGVRNIKAFNARNLSEEAKEEITNAENSENVIPVKLPYIVVIIDELADLMMVAQDKVETAIMRLAQLSRAVGIHLILATQRPSVDVITGVIKANFPARISFKVASKVDSRTVLDGMGAESLLGRGDMLFIQPGGDKPIRGQGSLVTDEEINRLVEFLSSQRAPEYHSEIISAQEGKTAGGGALEKDELFDEAVSIVLETGQASTSNLQRRLRLGYTRAARIIDQMEAEGLIGPTQGAKPREIYISREPAASTEEE